MYEKAATQFELFEKEVTMPSCVLKLSGIDWEGPTGAIVVIDVRSDNNNSSTIDDAAYPDGTKLQRNASGLFQLTIVAGSNPLTVEIVPGVPPDNWQIVEICPNGTVQRLRGFPAGDQDGSVIIRGV